MDEVFLFLIKAGFRFCILLVVFPFAALFATPFILMAAIPAKEKSEFLINCQSNAAETYLARVFQKYTKLLDYFLSGWDTGI
ncbi:MAG: hypothetical protein QM496_10820 [Verrucomicrobiota bacterium]